MRFLLPLLVATPALAQEVEVEVEPAPTQKVKFKERTEVDFVDSVEVNGTVTKPGLTMVDVATPADDMNPLIELRRDFMLEMAQSIDTIK